MSPARIRPTPRSSAFLLTVALLAPFLPASPASLADRLLDCVKYVDLLSCLQLRLV